LNNILQVTPRQFGVKVRQSVYKLLQLLDSSLEGIVMEYEQTRFAQEGIDGKIKDAVFYSPASEQWRPIVIQHSWL
jgi:hypothetical protein